MNTNTKTILNIKTEKSVKMAAKKAAEEIGVPLSTVINAFLKQFARDKEVTFSAGQKPSPYLLEIIEKAESEFENNQIKPVSGDDFVKHLKKL